MRKLLALLLLTALPALAQVPVYNTPPKPACFMSGTYTPTYATTGTAFGAVAMASASTGAYTRIGNTVIGQGFARTDSITNGSASGTLTISLPLAVSGDTGSATGALMVARAATWNANAYPARGIPVSATSTATLYTRSTADGQDNAVGASGTATAINSNHLQFAFVYITDAACN